MDLATSQQMAEWLRKRFQPKQEQLSPEAQQEGQRGGKFWGAINKVSSLNSEIGNIARRLGGKGLDVVKSTAKDVIYNPETKRVLPQFMFYPENVKKVEDNPRMAAMDLAMQFSGSTKNIGSDLSKIATKVETVKLNPTNLSKEMTNSLENTGYEKSKPGGVARAIEEIQNTIKKKKKRPIEIRTVENGKTVIEDGRHLLEGARVLGIKEWPVKDVTAKYNPELIDKLSQYIQDKKTGYMMGRKKKL